MVNKSIVMEFQKLQLKKMQLQALLVNVQTFIDQFSVKKIDQVYSYIDMKDPNLFPEEIKDIAKNKFASLMHQ